MKHRKDSMNQKKNSSNKIPAIMFYTGDWMKDPAVRALRLSERGLWIDMLCIMYESQDKGYLSLANGCPVTNEQLARMVGGQLGHIEECLHNMEATGVFSRTKDGVLYSRRMVADEKLRQSKSDAGKKGMESRYNKPLTTPQQDVNRGANRDDNKALTPLEYEDEVEYEIESVIDTRHSSSHRFIRDRIARTLQVDSNIALEVQDVLECIPKDRLNNPIKTAVEVQRILDEVGGDRQVSAMALGEKLRLYYESDQGRGEYAKLPHNFLKDNCHLADPSSWTKKKETETTGWDSIPKGN